MKNIQNTALQIFDKYYVSDLAQTHAILEVVQELDNFTFLFTFLRVVRNGKEDILIK